MSEPQRLYTWLRRGRSGKVAHIVPPTRPTHTVCGRSPVCGGWVKEMARPNPTSGRVAGYRICAECNRMKDAATMLVQQPIPGAGPRWVPLQWAISHGQDLVDALHDWQHDDVTAAQQRELEAIQGHLVAAVKALERYRVSLEGEEDAPRSA